MRWLVTLDGARLHRISEVDLVALQEDCVAVGTTVCGYRGNLHVPGVVARMAGRRCATCCALVGVSQGEGAPFNTLSGADRDR